MPKKQFSDEEIAFAVRSARSATRDPKTIPHFLLVNPCRDNH